MKLSLSRARAVRAALIPLLMLVSGCTREKAEAVKVAASHFAKEAVLALDAYEGYFAQMIPNAALNEDEFAAAFAGLAGEQPDAITPEIVDGLLNLLSAAPQTGQIELADDFQQLRNTYEQFAAAFDRVTAGNLFSQKPVKSATGLAARLTVQLVTFRQQAAAVPSIDATRRTELQVALRHALRETDGAAKEALLQSEARNAIVLHAREAELAENVQAQFARAIIAGETLCGLIKNYDQLSAAEILGEIKSKLSLAATITGRADVAALATELDGVEARIRSDPFFSLLLDQPVLNLTPVTDGP